MKETARRVARWTLLVICGGGTLAFLIGTLNDRPVGVATVAVASSGMSRPDSFRSPGAGPANKSASVARAVADVDAEFQRHWAQEGLDRAPPADWMTVCRRLSLALVGSGMSLEEIRALQALPEATRIATHRERLLADRRFADYWAERFARVVVGTDAGPFLVYRRRRFVTWLSEQIATNQPYDSVVRQLLTARGYFTDRPEVNFITATMDSGEEGQPDPVRLAGRTTRAFLGMRIDCMQCHDDFLGNVRLGSPTDPREGTQQDFHQLAAFFSDSRFNILQGIRTEEHPYRYTYLDADEETVVQAAVPFAEELLPERGEDAERLAAWITHPNNRQSRRALANRVWALMFGQPLHQPVDDIPINGPLPPALDRLADAVGEEQWDLRQLIRIISQSAVFQISSRADFEITPEHEQAWAVFPLNRLRPEQVARGIVQASRLTTIDDSSAFLLQLLAYGSENDFVRRYGDTGEDEFNLDSITITQRLLMMNGELVQERIGNNPVLNAATHINMFAPDSRTAVETVYLAVLNRLPTERERDHFVHRLDAAEERENALSDLYWVLLNGSELAWNH